MKLLIQEQFFGDVHYVWCSDACDSGAAPAYSVASLIPPSSNPKDIYRDLRTAVEKGDTHHHQIVQTRSFYIQHATTCHAAGTLTDAQRDDLVYMVTNAQLKDWRPLLYVIPRAPVAGRLQAVPAARRAGHGMEYIISDLARAEFDIVEL
jgi:hypothetical protein